MKLKNLSPFAMNFPVNAQSLDVYDTSTQAADGDVMSALAQILADNGKLKSANTQLMTAKINGKNNTEMNSLLKDFLPALDSFERIIGAAKTNTPESEEARNWIKSIDVVYAKLLNSLKAVGLQPLATVGMPVDLNVHDVIEYRKTDVAPHNAVISEIQRGYSCFGQLLREARVVVACNTN